MKSPQITRATITTFGGCRITINKGRVHPPPQEGDSRTDKNGVTRRRTGFKHKSDEEPRFKRRAAGTIAWRWVSEKTYADLHADPLMEERRKRNAKYYL